MNSSEKKMTNHMLIAKAAIYDDKDDSIWMATAYGSYLINIDLKKEKITKDYIIPNVDPSQEYNFLSMCMVNSCIYLAPYNADVLMIFNMDDEHFEVIDIPYSRNERKSKGKFRKIVSFNNALYLIGYRLHAVYKMNIVSKNINRIYADDEDGYFSFCDVIIANKSLYIPKYDNGSIDLLNLETESLKTIKISCVDDGFSSAIKVEDGIDFITRKGKYISCNENLEVKKTLNIYEKPVFEDDMIYGLFENGGEKYGFNLFSSIIWHICNDGRVLDMNFKYPYSDMFSSEHYSKYEFILNTLDYIYFQTRTDGEIYKIIPSKGIIEHTNITIPDTLDKSMGKQYLKNKIFVREDYLNKFEAFVSNVAAFF